MEVPWNTHREWRRGVLVFRYRSKVCKKLKALAPFCFAVRHDVPVICHGPPRGTGYPTNARPVRIHR